MRREQLDELINAVIASKLYCRFDFKFYSLDDLNNFYRAFGCIDYINVLTDSKLPRAPENSPSRNGLMINFVVIKCFRDRNDEMTYVNIKGCLEKIDIVREMEISGERYAVRRVIDVLQAMCESINLTIRKELTGLEYPNDRVFELLEQFSTKPAFNRSMVVEDGGTLNI